MYAFQGGEFFRNEIKEGGGVEWFACARGCDACERDQAWDTPSDPRFCHP